MLREEIPRDPSKRAQTDWQMRSKKGQRLGDAYYTVYRAPVESRNQGLDHEGGWKQIHTSWFPVQWGTVPTFRLYLVCIFVHTLPLQPEGTRAYYLQATCKRNEIRKHRALQTICPPKLLHYQTENSLLDPITYNSVSA